MIVSIWSIKVFRSCDMISDAYETNMDIPSLEASDVNDVQAEFVADPFIVNHDSRFFMFFEVFNKGTGRGEIGLATSLDGRKWTYENVVLREKFHLSYPQVFTYKGETFMLPETEQANRVLLYKSKNFPCTWEVVSELFSGRFLDPSIVHFNGKWWIFAGTAGGDFRLFFSEKLEGPWMEHPQSPVISNNRHITRPGGRMIVSDGNVYRYTQSVVPYYGHSVRVFKVIKLTVLEYTEEEISLILSGTQQDNDWRKDGMHHIDQLKINEGQWLVAVDGHRFKKSNYFIWKLERIMAKIFN